jgi:hypothetical protein
MSRISKSLQLSTVLQAGREGAVSACAAILGRLKLEAAPHEEFREDLVLLTLYYASDQAGPARSGTRPLRGSADRMTCTNQNTCWMTA